MPEQLTTSFPHDGTSVARLVSVMKTLLGPAGCAWDREQTLETLRAYVIEEAYEVADAIDQKDGPELRDELGDLLLQIVFQSELTPSAYGFGLDDVVEAIVSKMIRRHPHVFGDVVANTAEEVLANWEKNKIAERRAKESDKGVLDGVPTAMPALLRATRIGEKAAGVGFDWTDLSGPRSKIDEELAELDEAIKAKAPEQIEAELGDVLFSLTNLARRLGVDPEAALRGTTSRFESRFKYIEQAAKKQDREVSQLSPAEYDLLWNEAKAASR